MACNELTRKLIAAYDVQDKVEPEGFLRGLFGRNSTELTVTEQCEIELHTKDRTRPIAIDTSKCKPGHLSRIDQKYEKNIFTPPHYHEVMAISPCDFMCVRMGLTRYNEEGLNQRMVLEVAGHQIRMVNKIKRAIEKQASDALFNGKIVLKDNTEIDFGRDASLETTPAITWDNVSTADPVSDIAALCSPMKNIGKCRPDTLIFGSQAWHSFISNEKLRNGEFNFRRADFLELKPRYSESGVTFQGMLRVTDCEFEIYTYDQCYDIVDANNEIVSSSTYVPEKQVLVMSSRGRYDKYFTGIPMFRHLTNYTATTGLPGLNTEADKFKLYGYPHEMDVKFGVMSAPLLVPVSINCTAVINAVA